MHMYYNVETFGTNADFGYIADPVNSTKWKTSMQAIYLKIICSCEGME